MRPPAHALLLLLAPSALACSATPAPRPPSRARPQPLARPPLPQAHGARFPPAPAGAVIVVTSDQLFVEAPAGPSRPPRQRAVLPLLSGALVSQQERAEAQLAPLSAALRELRARDPSADRVSLAAPPASSWRFVYELLRAAAASGYAEVDLLVEQPGDDGAVPLRPLGDAPPALEVAAGGAGYALSARGDHVRPGCATFGSPAVAVPRRADGGHDVAGLRACAARMVTAPWWPDVGGSAAVVSLALQPELTAQDAVDVASALREAAPGLPALVPALLRGDGPPAAREGADPDEHATPRPPPDMPSGEGEIDAAAVAARVRGQLSAIRGCYERELRRDATLAGRVEVWFRVALDGSVTAIDVRQPDGFGEVGACIARVFRALAMPRPTGGEVQFAFPFMFRQ